MTERRGERKIRTKTPWEIAAKTINLAFEIPPSQWKPSPPHMEEDMHGKYLFTGLQTTLDLGGKSFLVRVEQKQGVSYDRRVRIVDETQEIPVYLDYPLITGSEEYMRAGIILMDLRSDRGVVYIDSLRTEILKREFEEAIGKARRKRSPKQ